MNPNNNARGHQRPTQPTNGKRRQGFNISWIYIIILSLLVGSYFFTGSQSAKEVAYSDFKQYAQQGFVEGVTIFSNNTMEVDIKADSAKKVFTDAEIAGQKDDRYTLTINIPSVEETTSDLRDMQFDGRVNYQEGKNYWYLILVNVLPIAIFIIFIVLMNRRMMGSGGMGGGVFNVGKSKAQLFDKSAAKVTFKDVAGLAGDVRRCRCQPCARPLPSGQGESALYHLH